MTDDEQCERKRYRPGTRRMDYSVERSGYQPRPDWMVRRSRDSIGTGDRKSAVAYLTYVLENGGDDAFLRAFVNYIERTVSVEERS